MKLTIAIITMNRAEQLNEAIQSCLCSRLPENTEFVIIDNASTDNTASMVQDTFKFSKYPYYYEKLKDNLGVGGGRNYAFSKSSGDYVYFLDDDAFIDTKNDTNFFWNAINYLDEDESIKTLTTQIFDLLWQRNRVEIDGPEYKEGLYKCYRFCGGSHFLRKTFFDGTEPYFPNKYGLEEIFPSLRVVDKGGINVFAPSLNVIHNPKFNKWTSDNRNLVVTEIASKYAMKSMIYPILASPVLYLAFLLRIYKTLELKDYNTVHKRIKEVKIGTRTKRIKISTVMSLYRDFGLSVF